MLHHWDRLTTGRILLEIDQSARYAGNEMKTIHEELPDILKTLNSCHKIVEVIAQGEQKQVSSKCYFCTA